MNGPQRRDGDGPLDAHDPMASTRIHTVPTLDDAWVARLADIWFEVAVAGGAVGLVAPFGRVDARHLVEEVADSVSAGLSVLLAACPSNGSGQGPAPSTSSELPGARCTPGDAVAWVRVESNTLPIVSHWAWIKHLMVLPSFQGVGLGGQLLRVAESYAFGDQGLEAVYLTCRSGTGLEDFYAGHGYREVGRMPGNLMLPDGERRDEIYFLKSSLGGS